MKKRILSILLILCMVLMLVPATAFAETPSQPYTVTRNFKYGTLLVAVGGNTHQTSPHTNEAGEGERFGLGTVIDCAPYKFVGWKETGSGTVYAAFTNVTVTRNLTFDAVYEVDGSLAITVDGFEVGNTPADTTLSFASTIPGVTFSADDILPNTGGWYKYMIPGALESTVQVGDNEAFQADTQYQFYINLDNKGLTQAPAVTVNGETPDHCSLATRNGVPYAFVIGCEFGTPSERSQYTITYDGGEGVEGSIAAGTKNHGENYTLSSKTFTRDGYVQIGWEDKEGNRYKLGGTYTQDADMTFYPVWDEILTLSVPFTTTVALKDAGEPGETSFELVLIDGSGNELTYEDEYLVAVVNTDGAGDYDGSLTITAPLSWFKDMILEGAFIWQYDDEEEGWTYDDTVWGVRLYQPEIAARSVSEPEYSLLIYPTYVMDNGSFNLDLNAGPVDKMTFTNTYDAHAYELKHNEKTHWDECSGCKDKQNEEPHKYGDWKVIKAATQTAKGEKEHTCTICGYTEKAEIAKLTAADTTDTTKNNQNTGAATSPDTGDNSHMALWMALLFVSAGLMTAAGAYSRKKRSAR